MEPGKQMLRALQRRQHPPRKGPRQQKKRRLAPMNPRASQRLRTKLLRRRSHRRRRRLLPRLKKTARPRHNAVPRLLMCGRPGTLPLGIASFMPTSIRCNGGTADHHRFFSDGPRVSRAAEAASSRTFSCPLGACSTNDAPRSSYYGSSPPQTQAYRPFAQVCMSRWTRAAQQAFVQFVPLQGRRIPSRSGHVSYVLMPGWLWE
mmetsp:Transcript_27128/g.74058  ORF Transcript_27128/g.74058 Transcript_27128/m.74058 type:complete len:204 (-) Transcript_27128:591-1202(-)